MLKVTHYSEKQNRIIADNIEAISGLRSAGLKIPLDGVSVENFGGHARVRVEFIQDLTPEQAQAIVNATPVDSIRPEVTAVQTVTVREDDGGLWLSYDGSVDERWVGPVARAAIAEYEKQQPAQIDNA